MVGISGRYSVELKRGFQCSIVISIWNVSFPSLRIKLHRALCCKITPLYLFVFTEDQHTDGFATDAPFVLLLASHRTRLDIFHKHPRCAKKLTSVPFSLVGES